MAGAQIDPGMYLLGGGGTKALEPINALMRSEREDLARTPGTAFGLVAWYYRCVHLRAHAVSAMPYVIQWAEGMENAGQPVPDGDIPWKKKLRKLLWQTEASLCLYGRAYLFRQQNLVVTLGLRFLNPSTIKEHYGKGWEGLDYFERRLVHPRHLNAYRRGEEAVEPSAWEETINDRGERLAPGGGYAQRLEKSDVIYFWYPDPEVEIGPGRPPGSVALEAAGLARAIGVFSTSFFDRACIPATVLQVEGSPPEQQLKELESRWKRMLRGTGSAVRRAWETIAVSSKVKPLVVGAPVRDLGMPTLKELVRREMCAGFGVPVSLLADSSNYASAREARKSFYSETIVPECELIAETMNEQLLNPRGMELKFTPEQTEVMQEDEVQRAGALVTLRNAGVPLLQAMKILGYDMDKITEGELTEFVEDREGAYQQARNRAAAEMAQRPYQQQQQMQQVASDPLTLLRHQTAPIDQARNANGLARNVWEP